MSLQGEAEGAFFSTKNSLVVDGVIVVPAKPRGKFENLKKHTLLQINIKICNLIEWNPLMILATFLEG